MIFVGLSHHTAPLEVRERLAFHGGAFDDFRKGVLDVEGVAHAIVLITCNRVEVYASLRDGRYEQSATEAIRALLSSHGEGVARCLVSKVGVDAVEHLLRVASSLESLVIGEPQILGQLKQAAQVAESQGGLGRELRGLFNLAFHTAKRIRTETEIGAGQASVPTAAVRLARQIFGELEGRRVVLIGAGEMAQSAAKVLANAGAAITIVNRSRDRALRLQRNVGGRIAPWGELESQLAETDIVLSSTACPAIILTRATLERVRRARRGRSLFLIDIAVPRDIDPSANDIDGMYVYDVDDLSRIVEESRATREAAAQRAAAIVEEEIGQLRTLHRSMDITPVIKDLRARTESVLRAEMERSLKGKLRTLSNEERGALEAMVRSAANKLMHEPTVRLRMLANQPDAHEQVACIRDVFGLPPGEEGGTREAASVATDVSSPWMVMAWEAAR